MQTNLLHIFSIFANFVPRETNLDKPKPAEI